MNHALSAPRNELSARRAFPVLNSLLAVVVVAVAAVVVVAVAAVVVVAVAAVVVVVNHSGLQSPCSVQVALVIRGFAIRGFDYSRFAFCYQNLIFVVFSLGYSRC